MQSLQQFINESQMKPLKSMILEMANILPEYTGLPINIWIQKATDINHGEHNTPRLKVKYNDELIPVSIEDEPKILVNKNIDSKTWKKVSQWIKKNKDILLKVYNSEIEVDDFKNQIVK